MTLSKIIQFITTDIWRIRLTSLPRAKSFFIKQLRIIILAVRGYSEDKCKFRASALTFFSLLSIVPVFAMIFGIAKGFGLKAKVEEILLEKMQGQEQVAEKIIAFSNSLLENARGGLIAGIGIAILFWSIIKVLGNIENSFNYIWGVKKDRSIGRKLSDYLSVILICPVLLVMASSITVVVTGQLRLIIDKISFLGAVAPFVLFLISLIAYATIWVIFTFIFVFMPNTKVKFKSGLIGGIVAGTIFQLVQRAYIGFQIGAAKYGAVYGSFAALPLFLIWLQISWLVVLFGAELSFAHQNVDTYEFEKDCLNISYSFKKLLSLLITHSLVRSFCTGKKPQDASEISKTLDIPVRLVRQILFELVNSGIVSEVRTNEDKNVAYQPAHDVDTLTVKAVIDALEQRGDTAIPVAKSAELDKLSDCVRAFSSSIEQSPSNVLLKSI